MKLFLMSLPSVALILLVGHAPHAQPQSMAAEAPRSASVDEIASKLKEAFAQVDAQKAGAKKPEQPQPNGAGVFKDQELPATPKPDADKTPDKTPVKPADAPKPVSKPKPKPASGSAPAITVDAPKSVEMGHLIHVSFTNSGGPIREQEIRITPQPADGDFMYGTREIIDADGTPLRVEDKNTFAFVAPEGPATIEWWFIGSEKGHQRGETRIMVRDTRPAKAPAAEAQGPQQPQDLVKKWASEVPSANRAAEQAIVARAAHEASKAIGANPDLRARAVEEWRNQAYLLLGQRPFANWNQDAGRAKSFFSQVNDLIGPEEAKKIPDFDPQKYLDYFGDVLEGK